MKISRTIGSAAVATALLLAPVPGIAATNNGWWVVLGSVASPDNNFTPQVESAVRRIEAAARRCGLDPFHDSSSKFRGFAPGYTVVVLGAFTSRERADQALAAAQRCVAEAYLRQGSYAGE